MKRFKIAFKLRERGVQNLFFTVCFCATLCLLCSGCDFLSDKMSRPQYHQGYTEVDETLLECPSRPQDVLRQLLSVEEQITNLTATINAMERYWRYYRLSSRRHDTLHFTEANHLLQRDIKAVKSKMKKLEKLRDRLMLELSYPLLCEG